MGVIKAEYLSRTNRIIVHLVDGSSYWATSIFTYLNYPDNRIGPFEKGPRVIVCPGNSNVTRRMRSNIVGNVYLTFHKSRH
jgi:hypothetical protein